MRKREISWEEILKAILDLAGELGWKARMVEDTKGNLIGLKIGTEYYLNKSDEKDQSKPH